MQKILEILQIKKTRCHIPSLFLRCIKLEKMAKITKKNVLSIQGIANIENGKITFSVEDIEGEIALAELMSDFNGQEVKLSVNQTDEIA